MCYSACIFDKVDKIEAHIHLELRLLMRDNVEITNRIENGSIVNCCVCGEPIKRANLQRKTRNFLWCSRKCYSEKPKKIIALEQAYGKDIREVLIETTIKYQNIRAQQNALKISTPHLYKVIRKYFGSDYISFFAKYAVGNRQAGYARKLKQRKRNRLPD